MMSVASISERNFAGYASEHLVRFDLFTKHLIPNSPDIPWTHYDLIVSDGSRMVTVQIKTNIKHDGRKIAVDNRKSNGSNRNYTKDDYEVLAIVDLENKRVAYLPYSVWKGKTKIVLWLEHPKTLAGFKKGDVPVMFNDYLQFPNEGDVV